MRCLRYAHPCFAANINQEFRDAQEDAARNERETIETFLKEKSKAKEIIEARFHPSDLRSTIKQRVLEKEFPDFGDLVVIRVVYTDELAAECMLLEYNEQGAFLLRDDEDPQDILVPGNVRIAFVLRANKTNGNLLSFASANQISF
jgi:hypothetical protein